MKKVVNLILLLMITATACSNHYTPKRLAKLQMQIDAIPIIVDSAVYQNDSLQIVNSIRWGFNNDTHFFNFEVSLGSQKSKEINIYVDRIFYSSDSSQLFAIAIIETPTKFIENSDALENPENKYFYDGIIIISNIKKDDKWVLYPLNWYRPMGWTCYEQIKYMFYSFYLNEMLERKGHDYGCAISEECFWSDSNGFWRYGEIIPGYYNYEVRPHKDYFKATGKAVDSSNINDYLIKPLKEY